MKTKSQEIAAQLKAKAEGLDALLYKEGTQELKGDWTSEQVTAIQDTEKAILTLEGEFKAAQGIEDLATKNADRLNTLNTVKRPGFDGNTQKIYDDAQLRKAGDMRLEGSELAGHSWVQKTKDQGFEQLSLAYEEGILGLSAQQQQIISTKEYKHAFRNYIRKGLTEITSLERKTLQEGTDSQGGFLVPEDVLNMILSKSPTPTRVSGYVSQLTTSRDQLLIPRTVYTTDDLYSTGIRTTWTGEIPSSSTVHRVTDPVFGQLRIPVHTNMMSLPLTNDMIEDSAFPIVRWASEKFNETIDLLKDNMIINGTGSGQPAGILLNPDGTDQPAVVVTGSAAALTADGIIDLAYSLPEQYDMNARFLFNKTASGKAIAKLKDSDNRYLFGYGMGDNGLAGGRPTELVGYQYSYSGFMPSPAANTFPLIFGDFRGYILLNRIGFSIQVLRETYAELNQIVLLGRIRFGGQVAESYKLKIQKCST